MRKKRGGPNILFQILAIPLAVLLLAGCLDYALNFTNDVQPLNNWKYAYANRLSKLNGLREKDMYVTEDGTFLNDGNYMILVSELPKNEYGTLCVLTDRNKISVYIGSELVYDTLSQTQGLFGRKLNKIPITPEDAGKQVTIRVYGPVSMSVEVYLTNLDSRFLRAGQPIESDVVMAAIFGALGLLILLLSSWFPMKSKGQRLCSLLVVVLGVIGLLANSELFSGNIRSTLTSAKISTASLSMACTLGLLIPWIDQHKDSMYIEKFVVLNMGYALSLMLWPYAVFLEYVFKLSAAVQVLNTLSVAYHVYKDEVSMDWFHRMGMFTFQAANLIFWTIPANHPQNHLMNAVLFSSFLFLSVAAMVQFKVDLDADLRIYVPTRGARADRKPAEVRIAPEVLLENRRTELLAAEKAAFDRAGQRAGIKELTDMLCSSRYTGEAHHMYIVYEYVRILARHYGMESQNIQDYADAALLHDVGKLYVPEGILHKTERLSDEEYAMIKRHNQFGYDILSKNTTPFSQLAARVALEHHEHSDGTGYLGMGENQICAAAKITAAVDVFSALTVHREYKNDWSFDEAYEYVVNRSGTEFSPVAVKLFQESRDEMFRIYQSYQNILWSSTEIA